LWEILLKITGKGQFAGYFFKRDSVTRKYKITQKQIKNVSFSSVFLGFKFFFVINFYLKQH